MSGDEKFLAPSPSVIGHSSKFELQITTADSISANETSADDGICKNDEMFGMVLESRAAHQSRRQWFYMNARKRHTASTSSIELERMVDAAKQSHPTHLQPLNEHGHNFDRDTYRMRREWYMQKTEAKDVSLSRVHDLPSQKEGQDLDSCQSWRVLARACCIMVFALSVWFSSNAFLSDICHEYGMTKTHGNLLTVFVNIGFTVGATTSAIMQVPDRFHPSKLLQIGSLLCSVSNALLVLPLSFEVLLLVRFVNGIALSFVYPVLVRYVSSWFPPAKRGLALGILLGSLTVGIALPSLIKALLPDMAWEVVILGASALPIVACMLSCNSGIGPHVPRMPAFSFENVRRVLCTPGWFLVTFSYVGHNMELWGGWAWIGAFLKDRIEMSEEVGSVLSFGVLACGVVGATLGGLIADCVGKRALIISCHAISGVSLALLPSLSKVAMPAVVLLVAGVWGSAVIADSAQHNALLAEVLPEKRLLGTAVALSMAVGFLSTAVGIYIVPPLVEWGGWDKAFPCLALGAAFGVVLMLLVRVPFGIPQEGCSGAHAE